MRQPLFKIRSFECWRFTYTPDIWPRFKRENWDWNDGRKLRKLFVRVGKWIYAFAWFTGARK